MKNQDPAVVEQKAIAGLSRAKRAQDLLNDELFQNAVAAVREASIKQFTDSRLDDDKTRRMARMRLAALDGLLKDIEKHIADGKFHTRELEILRGNRG